MRSYPGGEPAAVYVIEMDELLQPYGQGPSLKHPNARNLRVGAGEAVNDSGSSAELQAASFFNVSSTAGPLTGLTIQPLMPAALPRSFMFGVLGVRKGTWFGFRLQKRKC